MTVERLKREVQHELNRLRDSSRLAAELAAVAPPQRRSWDAAAAAKLIADLWMGLENLCKRRYRHLDLPVPEGPRSHREVLDDFLATDGLGAALSQEMRERLEHYLQFRHRFIHGYGDEVNWDIVEEPLRLLEDTVNQLATTWESWLNNLEAQ
jgi:hypothetical protein